MDRLDPPPGLLAVCAGYENGTWRAEQLARHLMEWLPEFALKYTEWSGLGAHNALDQPILCKEPLILKAGPPNDPDAAQVHHVVRRKDLRGCDWGTNSNKNAVVISRKLNGRLLNKYPSAEEVTRVNQAPAYTP